MSSPVSLPSPHWRTWVAFPQEIQKQRPQHGTEILWKMQISLFPYNNTEIQVNGVLKLTGSALFFLKKKQEKPLVSATLQAQCLIPRHQNSPFWKGSGGWSRHGHPPRTGRTGSVLFSPQDCAALTCPGCALWNAE